VHDTNLGDDVSISYYIWQLGYGLFPWTGLCAAGLLWWVGPATSGALGRPGIARADVSVYLALWAIVGTSYARRLTRQDMEFAVQMFENATSQDGNFALAHAAIANVCAQYYYHLERETRWIERARTASSRADSLRPDLPDVQVARAWILYAEGAFDAAVRLVKQAIEHKSDCEGGYYLLGRSLFAAGDYRGVEEMAEAAIKASGQDYNVYVPITNALGALGKKDACRYVVQQRVQVLEAHLKKVPEDARARTLLAADYADMGRVEDAMREANLAMNLRPDEATVLYNIACFFCSLDKIAEALDALSKAWHAGFKDPVWVRRDPDLTKLHGDPHFEKLYPADS
jgi:tetratricopeptide (TPR) repeat protein